MRHHFQDVPFFILHIIMRLISTALSNRCVFDAYAECIGVDGRRKCIQMSAFSRETY